MKIKKIFNKICKLNIIELSRLLNKIKKKFNVNSKNVNFDNNKDFSKKIENPIKKLFLNELGDSKISVIKLLKEVTNLDLIKSKKLTDNLPSIIIENSDLKLINEIKKKFEFLGCKLEIK